MNTDTYMDLFNDLDDNEETENFINKDKRRQRFPERHFKYVRAANAEFLKGQDDSSRSFNFTYQAARFEEWWLLESLGDFYEHKWISDVLRRLKGGKEASVRSEEHTSELQSRLHLVCRLLLEKKKR